MAFISAYFCIVPLKLDLISSIWTVLFTVLWSEYQDGNQMHPTILIPYSKQFIYQASSYRIITVSCSHKVLLCSFFMTSSCQCTFQIFYLILQIIWFLCGIQWGFEIMDLSSIHMVHSGLDLNTGLKVKCSNALSNLNNRGLVNLYRIWNYLYDKYIHSNAKS